MAFSDTITRRQWLASSAAWGGALLSECLTAGFAAHAADAPLDVTIANTDGTATRILTELMTRQHYFEEFGLKPKFNFILGAPQLVDSLVKGESDVCMASGVSGAIASIATGAPLRLLSAANRRVVQAIYSAKPEIKTLKDLEGRRVGSGPKGALVQQIIFAAMLKAGADPTKVDFVNLGNSNTIFKAVAKGEIDAGTGEAEVYENQAKYGVHALEHGVLWDELPDYTNQGTYASLDAIKTKREQLVRTLAAHAKVYRFLQTPESREPYAAASVAMGHADPVEIETQWGFYQRFKPFAVDLTLSEEGVRYIQQLNVAMGLQKEILPFNSVVDISLAREAISRLKT